MDFNQNRLRFVHCEHLFSNFNEIAEYVRSVQYERSSLYAEPMIFKYGDEKNPNIVLAIGSVGDGTFKYDTETGEVLNKTFYIDFSQVERDIKKIYELIGQDSENVKNIERIVKNIVNGCGFNEDGKYVPEINDLILSKATSLSVADKMLSEYIIALEKKQNLKVEDTKSIDLTVDKTENGTVLKGDVKLGTKIFDNKVIENILVEQEDGIFISVDLNYVEKESKLTLVINGEDKKDIILPTESHVIKGEYDPYTEKIILSLNNPIEIEGKLSDKVEINVSKLIDEWNVLGEASETPIILTKEHVKAIDSEHEGIYDYQDILKADVRILDKEKAPDNILQKDSTGKYLYVDGSAVNISYVRDGEKINVQQGLDEKISKTDISKREDNTISLKNDGIYSSVDIEFNSAENTLLLKKSNTKGEIVVSKYKLNSVDFIEEAKYDSNTEEIVIIYSDGTGEQKELRIPMQIAIDAIGVDNTNSTVTLEYTKVTPGQDKLKANVNIAKIEDNIIENVGNNLYVKGTADNIKMIDISLGKTVEETISKLNKKLDEEINGESTDREEAINTLNEKLKEEIDRAKAAERVLQDNIDSESRRATAVEEELTRNLNSEIARSTNKDIELNDNLTKEINRATAAEETITRNLNSEIARSTEKDEDLDKKISDEAIRAQKSEHNIKVDLIKEKDRATAAEEELTRNLNSEIARSTDIDKKHDSLIEIETKRSTEKDAELEKSILDEKNRALEAEQVLRDSIKTETNRAITAETKLTELVKAEETRAINSENIISKNLKAEETRATNAEREIKEALDREVLRATEKENELKDKIDNEVIRSTEEDTNIKNDLRQSKLDLSYVVKNSGTIKLTKNKEEIGSSIIGEVVVSPEPGNIINNNGKALYSSVDLIYNDSLNTLTLLRSGLVDKEVKLNAGSLIDSIVYDDYTKELIIYYYNSYNEKKEVRVYLGELFNEWDVETDHLGAVKLEKIINYNGKGADKLVASVVVSSLDTNLLVNDKGSLYVSNSASKIVLADKTSLQDAINRLDAKDRELQKNIDDEKNRAIAAETEIKNNVKTLTDNLNAEVERSIKKDDELAQSILAETNRAEGVETALENRIDALESSKAEQGTQIGNVKEALDNEIKRAKEAESNLDLKISNETTRASEVEGTLSKSILDETNRAKEAETNLNTLITSEKTRAEKEETALGTRIDELTTKVDENTESINDLKTNVDDIKSKYVVSVTGTNSVELTKTALDSGYQLKGDVKISSDIKNILSVTKDGLLVTASLEYLKASNTLRFTANGKDPVDIQLDSVSGIKEITYDSKTDEIVIKYETNGHSEEEVRFAANKLFKPIVAKNDDKNIEVVVANNASNYEVSANLDFNRSIDNTDSTITLSATSENKLKAEVNISDRPKNILKKDSTHNLYVDGEASNISVATVALGSNVEEALQNIDDRVKECENVIGDGAIEDIKQDIIDLQNKTNLVAADSASIDLNFVGTKNSSSLKAHVIVSDTPEQLLSVKDDGMIHPTDNEGHFTDGSKNGMLFDGNIDYLTFDYNPITGTIVTEASELNIVKTVNKKWSRYLQFKRNRISGEKDELQLFNTSAEAIEYITSKEFLEDKKDGEVILVRYESGGDDTSIKKLLVGYVYEANGKKHITINQSEGAGVSSFDYTPIEKTIESISSDGTSKQIVIPAESLYFEWTDNSGKKQCNIVSLKDVIEEITYPKAASKADGSEGEVTDGVSVKEHHNVKFDLERHIGNEEQRDWHSILKADIDYYDCGEYDGEDYIK